MALLQLAVTGGAGEEGEALGAWRLRPGCWWGSAAVGQASSLVMMMECCVEEEEEEERLPALAWTLGR